MEKNALKIVTAFYCVNLSPSDCCGNTVDNKIKYY